MAPFTYFRHQITKMATQINQIDNVETSTTRLRIEGEMFQEDATLLQRIAMNIRSTVNPHVIIDLADLAFLDSDAAPMLKQLADVDGVTIEGIEIFLQTAVNIAERHHE